MRPAYGPAIAALLDERLPELGPGSPDESARPKLTALALNRSLAGAKIVDHSAARCCLAGLWLAHGFLDESHAISQEIDSAEGSYWHALVHRREPDYRNSKYWFHRVGQHAVFGPLAVVANELAVRHELDGPSRFLAKGSAWDPFAFVDLCAAIANGKSHSALLAREVARAEWHLLLAHCYRLAVGS